MNILRRLLREERAVRRILPADGYARWRQTFVRRLPQVLRARSLGPVDAGLGEQFTILSPSARPLTVEGASFGVVREIFGHECYGSAKSLAGCRQVLDLGGNAGVFTLFALSAAPHARVHAVEGQPHYGPLIERNVARNGFAGRATVENALVGGACNEWTAGLRRAHPAIPDFSMERYLAGISECDFLKCDVEGAEFAFLNGASGWLPKVRRIALEYHGDWQSGVGLADTLRFAGFRVRQAAHGSLGYLFADRT
jgi:hypothetical protein